MTGTEFAASILNLTGQAREDAILNAVRAGNVPDFIKTNPWRTVVSQRVIAGVSRQIRCLVTPDYFSLGTDTDPFRCPMWPATAQSIATQYNSIFASSRLSDLIWQAADARLNPRPFPPDALMESTPRFVASNLAIDAQLRALGRTPVDSLVAGDKKDVVVGPGLNGSRVAIYGWQQFPNGVPIQPYSTVHQAQYSDYSHGVRLVFRRCWVDDREMDIRDVFLDPSLNALVSAQGAFDPVFPNVGNVATKTPPMMPVRDLGASASANPIGVSKKTLPTPMVAEAGVSPIAVFGLLLTGFLFWAGLKALPTPPPSPRPPR